MELSEEEITKFINNRDFNNPIIKYDDSNKVKTKYIYTSYSNNYIYFVCNKRRKCRGAAKINIKNQKLIIIEKCDVNILHETITYKEFVKALEKNKLDGIDFSNTEIQKY